MFFSALSSILLIASLLVNGETADSLLNKLDLDEDMSPAVNLASHEGFLYIGARNWLLKVNSKTMRIEQRVRYGPVMDSAQCRYHPVEECSGSTHTVDNFNKVLLIYESSFNI